MAKSIGLEDETHKELIIEQGQLQKAKGIKINMDTLIKEMIIIWRKKR